MVIRRETYDNEDSKKRNKTKPMAWVSKPYFDVDVKDDCSNFAKITFSTRVVVLMMTTHWHVTTATWIDVATNLHASTNRIRH